LSVNSMARVWVYGCAFANRWTKILAAEWVCHLRLPN
jgi:hypothetical protein